MHGRFYALGLFLVVLAVPLSSVTANDRCPTNKDMGWHFYCETHRARERELINNPPSPASDAVDKTSLEQEAEQLARTQAQAVNEPSSQNMLKYLWELNRHTRRTNAYYERQQSLIEQHPGLDANYFTNRTFPRQFADMSPDEIKAKVTRQFSLIYLAGGAECVPCTAYETVLREIAASTKIHIAAASMSGVPLSGWPHNAQTRHILAEIGGVLPPPVTVMVDHKTGNYHVISTEILDYDELERRLFLSAGERLNL